VVTGPCRSF